MPNDSTLSPATERVVIAPQVVSGVDLMRGMLAILVLVSHAWEYTLENFPARDIPVTNRAEILWAYGLGGFSIRGFFVLSGFCINLSVINAVAAGTYTTWNYLLARFSRIYPMYLVGLGFALAAWTLNRLWLPGQDPLTRHFDTLAFLGQFVMTQGFFHAFPYYGPTWTLTCEVLYYAIWPVALLVLKRPTARAVVLTTLAVWAVTAVIVVVWKVAAHGATNSWIIPFWSVPAQAPLWFAGAWLASSWRSCCESVALRRLASFAWVFVVAAYLFLVYLAGFSIKAWVDYLQQYACVPVYLLAILWFQPRAVPGERTRRLCRYLGELSYPLYLLHVPLVSLGGAVLKHFDLARRPLAVYPLLVILALVVSGWLGVALENAIMRWRKELLRRHGMRNPLDAQLKPVPVSAVA